MKWVNVTRLQVYLYPSPTKLFPEHPTSYARMNVWFFCVLHTIQTAAQKIKFSIKGFLSTCDQIRSFLRIWSHLLKKSLMENFIFGAVNIPIKVKLQA